MSEALAPRQTCHGVLLDVFGVGLMITGESGVGKSECALELIKHGHQLVADDVVDISRVGRALFGESPEMVRDFMELRGVGIVDVKEIFGIGSIVRRMRIDLVIHLELWREGKDYDRLGNTEKTMDILGVELPLIELAGAPRPQPGHDCGDCGAQLAAQSGGIRRGGRAGQETAKAL